MVSVVIIAANAKEYIKEALDSTQDFDEVILYLNNSSDETKDIASRYNNVKIIQGYFDGYGPTKNRALSYASNSWVFVLDSDEVITKELKEEIFKELKDAKFNAYYVPRLNNFWGNNIKHLGLYPDYSIRLFNKDIARFNDREVHESIEYSGKKGYLKNHLIHYAYSSIEEFIKKQNIYSSMGAKPNRLKAFFSPKWTFFKMYILKLGFLEGWNGYIIAKLYSEYTFWKYIKT